MSAYAVTCCKNYFWDEDSIWIVNSIPFTLELKSDPQHFWWAFSDLILANVLRTVTNHISWTISWYISSHVIYISSKINLAVHISAVTNAFFLIFWWKSSGATRTMLMLYAPTKKNQNKRVKISGGFKRKCTPRHITVSAFHWRKKDF